ncbi:MAG: quinol:cytochrome C oxidoreductase [Fimbriimonadales bacterium]
MGTENTNDNSNRKLTIAEIRARLEGKTGRAYWRSLDELADTPEFREFLQDEFPQQARSWAAEMDRRQFLKFAGASLALAGLVSGCRFLPQEKIVPYVKAPEDAIPGKPLYFATAITRHGYATGLIATSHEGRPTKLEGNPKHPASLGAADAVAQASVLNLYDPDRSTDVLFKGEPALWDAFVSMMRDVRRQHAMDGGAGLRVLTETITSPSMLALLRRLQQRYPQMVWHAYEPVNRDNVWEGARLAFGTVVDSVYHLDQADRILSLDADFLCSMPGSVRYAHDFASRRKVRKGVTEANRLYAIESSVSVTGANADHRIGVKPSAMADTARSLASRLGVAVSGAPSPLPDAWLNAVVEDLRAHAGRSLVIVGDEQPAEVHALAHTMNAALGNVGRTVTYVEAPPRPTHGSQRASLRALVSDLNAGRVQTVLVLGGNPAYYSPADLGFAAAFAKARLKIHVGSHVDETAVLSDWHVPESHFLERWEDARAYDGTVSITQPLIEPLYRSRSPLEVLQLLEGDPRRGYDILTDHWRSVQARADFENWWERAKHDGFIANSALPPISVTLRPDLASVLPRVSAANGIDLVFRPDPTVGDGRDANNGWLQELPKPLITVTWDNPVLMSPALAERLGVDTQDVIAIRVAGQQLEAVAWVQPGHPEDTVTAYLGGGRTRAGKLGTGVGFDTYRLRTVSGHDFAPGAEIRKTGRKHTLAATQNHHTLHGSVTQHGRDLLRVGTLAEFVRDPSLGHGGHDGHEKDLTLYEPPKSFRDYQGHRWGMSIDLSACIGCNACVVACQAENNIPVVGKDQVRRGREMHWIRIDRYFERGLDDPDVHFQPVPCMHCEKAPCEPVCPVAATTHSHEGLNQMVYNRCIGTRYCSNNCPYKVRRFNFYKYSAGQPNMAPGNYDHPTLKLLANPDVTIRGRGVMEKCTYCVQRINAARIKAKQERRPIADGEVVPACVQTCPTGAIVFGDVADAGSAVSKLKSEPHDYGLLTELNTRPRTTYLARIKNPNPRLSEEQA